MRYDGSITDIRGISVGCAADAEGATGVTAVMFDRLMTAGVDVRGGGPGTFNTDILSPMTGGGVLDCIVLSGGSGFGLGSMYGAEKWLEEKCKGFDTGIKRIPMVSGAIIFDLDFGSSDVWPTPEMAYEACENAGTSVQEGSFGAGTGATVGKLLLEKSREKSGQGTCSIDLGGGLMVGAIAVVNALGDVCDGGRIIAGAHNDKGEHLDTLKAMLCGERADVFGKNTTISVVATNADLSGAMTTKLAMMAHDGYAAAIRPVHTLADGDTVFAVSTGELKADGEINRILAASAEAMRRAIVNAVLAKDGRRCQ